MNSYFIFLIEVIQVLYYGCMRCVDDKEDHRYDLEVKYQCQIYFKGIYFVIYGIISEFTDKGQFQYLTNLKGPQEMTYLYTTPFLSLR